MKKIALVLAVAMGLAFSADAFAATVIYTPNVAVGKVVVAQPAQKVVYVQQPQVVQRVRYVQPQPVQQVRYVQQYQYPQYQYNYVNAYQPPVQTVYIQPKPVNQTLRAVAATALGVGIIVAALAN